MSLTPHPALRRILTAAAAPAWYMRSLESVSREVAAIGRDLDGTPLVADAALDPLARALDLAAVLGSAIAPRDGAAWHPTRHVHGERIDPPPPPGEAQRRFRSPTVAVAVAVDDALAAADSVARAEAGAGGAETRQRRGAPALPHDAAAVAAALSRLARIAEREERESLAGPPREGTPASRRADRFAPPGERPGGGSRSEPPSRGDRVVWPGEGFATRQEVAAELRSRAAAAASRQAFDTVVQVGAPQPAVEALLREASERDEARSAEQGGRKRDTGARAEGRSPDAASAPPVAPRPGQVADRLEEVLGRVISADRRREESLDARSRWPAESVESAEPDLPAEPRAVTIPAVGGLRGLVQRAESTGEVVGRRGATVDAIDAPRRAGVVAARADEAELAERIDRLLRREARRQGIDLEGVEP